MTVPGSIGNCHRPDPRNAALSPAVSVQGRADGEGDDNSGRACAQQGEDDTAAQQQEQQ